MRNPFATAILALSASTLALAAVPASAAVGIDQGAATTTVTGTLFNGDGVTSDSWNHGRRGRHRMMVMAGQTTVDPMTNRSIAIRRPGAAMTGETIAAIAMARLG
jgi:hypothetical protein